MRQIEAAYKNNPNSTYTALSLAKLKESSLGFEAALKILSDSIERNPSSKQLHLNIAKLCIRNKENEYIQFIDTNLRKAFSDGDSNYEAQFWYARQNYLYGDVNKARKIYLAIRDSKLPNTFKDKKRGVVCNSEGKETTYYGLVARSTESFCFVNCPEFGEDIFIHYSAFGDKEWDKVVPGVKVSFELGFRLRGPVGVRAWLSE